MKKDIKWLKEEISIERKLLCESLVGAKETTVERIFNDGKEHGLIFASYKIDQLDEPETLSTGVKKDLKEAILGIEVTQFDGQKANLEELVNPKQLEKIISDWMPEVLSQEWIDSNSINASSDGVTEEYVHVGDLENLIIPKQELPVIPKYVADWIEKYREREANVWHLLNNVSIKKDCSLEFWSWLWGENNFDVLARAWLDGYEVEEEQKYYVQLKVRSSFGVVGVFLYKQGDEVLAGDNFKAYHPEEDKFRLTEQEIKDYDERFWAFAVPVEVAE